MGWDLHFIGKHSFGDILNDKEFKIRFKEDGAGAELYVIEDGEEKCAYFPGVTEDNYKYEHPSYGCGPYGCGGLTLAVKLFEKFGIKFFDDSSQDYFSLCDYCENYEEENNLIDYCCACDMISYFPDNEMLQQMIEKGQILTEKLYEKYKEDHKEYFEKLAERIAEASNYNRNDNLPF